MGGSHGPMCGALGNSNEPKRIIPPRLARSKVPEMEAIQSPGWWMHDVFPTNGAKLSVLEIAGSKTYSKCVSCVMIGYGLAHNDSRFILVQAKCPTSSRGSVGCIA
jgi:hypothetical protein